VHLDQEVDHIWDDFRSLAFEHKSPEHVQLLELGGEFLQRKEWWRACLAVVVIFRGAGRIIPRVAGCPAARGVGIARICRCLLVLVLLPLPLQVALLLVE
jgi:hypothetical protein